MKKVFKITWISVLSTLVKMLAQLLSKDGFQNFNSLKTAIGDIPTEFILVNFLVFVILTVVFIYMNNKIPSTKLSKGLSYSLSISLVWFVLRFEPNTYDKIIDYFVDTLIFFVPMLIYGVLLGYLSSPRKHLIDFSRSYYASIIVCVLWILFRVLYFIIDIDEPKTNHTISVLVWLVVTGAVIGFIFWMIYKNLRMNMVSSQLSILGISIIVFLSYYCFEFISLKSFYPLELLKITFDLLAISFGTLIGHVIFKKELDDKKTTF